MKLKEFSHLFLMQYIHLYSLSPSYASMNVLLVLSQQEKGQKIQQHKNQLLVNLLNICISLEHILTNTLTKEKRGK